MKIVMVMNTIVMYLSPGNASVSASCGGGNPYVHQMQQANHSTSSTIRCSRQIVDDDSEEEETHSFFKRGCNLQLKVSLC